MLDSVVYAQQTLFDKQTEQQELTLYSDRKSCGKGFMPAPILLAAIHNGKLHAISPVIAAPTIHARRK